MKRILSIFLIFTLAFCSIPLYSHMVSVAQSNGNLILNSGFENGLENWTLYNGDASKVFNVSAVETEKNSGEKSLYRYVGGTSSIYNQLVYQGFELQANTEYTLSFWIKGNPGWGRFYITDNTDPKTLNHDNTEDKILWHQWLGTTYSEWTEVSFDFYAADTATYNIYYYFSAPATDVYLDDLFLEEKYKPNMVENGSFSKGNSGWELEESYFTVNTDKYIDAAKAAHKTLSQEITFAGGHINAGFTGWLNQSVSVTKGNSYNISVDVYLPESKTEGCDIELAVGTSIDDIIAGNGTAITLSDFTYGENRWQTLTADYTPDNSLFSSTTETTLYFALRSATSNAELLIDNFKVGSLISNSGFEADDNIVWSINTEALTAEDVIFGQNYKLSFRYKGTGFADNVALWTMSTADDFDPLNTYVRGFITEDAENWKDVSYVFHSGTYTKLKLIFQTLNNEYRLDNINLVPTNEEITVEPLNRAILVEDMSGSYYTKFKQPAEGKNIIANEDFTGTATSGYNDALNFVSTENGGNAAGTIVSNSTETGASYLGNSSLKFSAGQDEETVYVPLSLEKDTTYWVGLYIKAGPYVADSNGWSRFSYGIADTSSGNFIRVEDITDVREANKEYTDRIQYIPRYDEEWHYVGFKFTTNGQTDLSFMLRGSRMTAYVDKLYVWEDTTTNTADFEATLDKVGPVTDIQEETTLLEMGDGGTNLVDNSSFENGTEFWGQEYRRVGVYGNNLNIADSNHTVQNNAFLYENKLLYPWNCYYIQWIDVEPDTDYTFSAKYAITQTGEGFFGVIAGYRNGAEICAASENMLFPSNGVTDENGNKVLPAIYENDMYIAKWDFTENSYEQNQNWQTVGVTFNSGDRNRIGFFVQDGGGTAYIDDVKLFESKYAVSVTETEDNFPDKFEVLNLNITVVDNVLRGITETTTLQDIADSLKNSQYIRFFDLENNEITDWGTIAQNGIEVRLMNGPVIKARATISDEKNLILNSGFENGLTSWSMYNGSNWTTFNAEAVTEEKNSGEKSLHRWIGDTDTYNQVLYQKIKLEPNEKYTLSFWVKGEPKWGRVYMTSNTDATAVDYDNTDNKAFWYQWGGQVYDEWTKLTYTFTALDSTEYLLSLLFAGAGVDVYFDDFVLVKEKNLISNPDFESGLDNWITEKSNTTLATVTAEYTTDDKYSGNNSLYCKVSSIFSTPTLAVYQNLKLKANTKYNLSFWVKGTSASRRAYISSNVDNPTNRDSTLVDEQLASSYSGWTKLTYSFTTAEETDFILCLLFQSKSVNVYIDDFVLTVYETEGDVSQNGITDSEDLILLKKYLLGIETNITDSSVANIIKDGNVNILDLIRLKKILSTNK